MVKAVIFDMDGLMVDTEELHSQAHAAVVKFFKKNPKQLSTGLFHIVGKSTKENSAIIREKYGIIQDIETMEDKRAKAYIKILKSKKIFPMFGLKKLINTLKKNKVKMAVGSSGFKNAVSLTLKILGLRDAFAAVVSLAEVKNPKPAPDIFLEAAKRLDTKPQYCLVLEDSQSGVEAAKNAGMRVIAVPSKFTKTQDFSKADKIVKSLNDITIKTLQNL